MSSQEPEAVRGGHGGTSDAEGVDVNAAGLGARRGDREEGRIVHVTVNQAFAEAVGPEGVRAYVDTLALVADRHRGDEADAVRDILIDRLGVAGIGLDPTEAAKLAERITDPTRGELVVATDDGRVLHGDAAHEEGGERSARQPEPGDPERPLYS